MKKRIFNVLMIVPFMFLSAGCKQYIFYDASDYFNPGTTSIDCCFFARDSVCVYNANLDKIDRIHINNRIFSSNDIKRIREETSFPCEYFEIVAATTVNLGYNLWPDGNTFDIQQIKDKHFFYMRIPCQVRNCFKKDDIALEIPITYCNNIFFIHNKGLTQLEQDKIKKDIVDVDSVSLEKWVARCRQGVKHVPRIRNRTIRYTIN